MIRSAAASLNPIINCKRRRVAEAASSESFVLSLDQGTTSSRALLVDKKGNIPSFHQKASTQIYPQAGWVEQDPEEIWQNQLECAQKVVSTISEKDEIKGLGITNQRETVVIWNKKTGKPVYNAIVWQDRRTADYCEHLKREGWSPKIREKTGLIVDAYFSASKIRWILDNIPGAQEAANDGQLAFGTVDSWLLWNLSEGRIHATDATNASRTMIYNIKDLDWDKELLDLFNIPRSMLPTVKSCSEIYCVTGLLGGHSIPVAGIAGDQHAALYGQMCVKKGMIKSTYGTGCFLMMNTGDKPITSGSDLLTTIALKMGDQVTYALEGSVFMGGAVIQWLKDELKIIKSAEEAEKLANSVDDNGGVYMVPAFAGLGAPHWDSSARGTIFGLTRGSNDGHIARAGLEAIAYQNTDVMKSMEKDVGEPIKVVRVDGGASTNDTMMQFQSDMLDATVVRPKGHDKTTALGAAYLAGQATGMWKDLSEIHQHWQEGTVFQPEMTEDKRQQHLKMWDRAVEFSKGWLV